MICKPSFSVIIPIYNTEDYLEEAIKSIVDQTIGFEDNIELILVNDGSTDSTEEICIKYRDKYKNNIQYVYQENSGVSAACNKGLELAHGEYINFFGSDDRWSKETFKVVKEFFDNHKEEVDVVTCKISYFGDAEGEHPLNFRHEKSGVYDLDKYPDFSQCSDGNCFFRYDAVCDRRFDTNLSNAEDALLLNDILLDKCAIGIVEDGEYHYRRRANSSGARNSMRNRFVVEPKLFCRRIYELSKERYGYVKPFISYIAMYEMQWRLLERPTSDITDEEIKEYERILKDILEEVSDDQIMGQREMAQVKKAYALRLKHGDDFFTNGVEWTDGRAYINDTRVYSLHVRANFQIEICEERGDYLLLRGKTNLEILRRQYELIARDSNGNEIKATIKPFPTLDVYSFNNDLVMKGTEFIFELPIYDRARYSFYIKVEGLDEVRANPRFRYYGKFDFTNKHSYFNTDKYIYKYEDNEIKVIPYKWKTHVCSEIRLLKELLKTDNEYGSNISFAMYRVMCFIIKSTLKGKEVWLLTDRDEHATDNASALFDYISKEATPEDKKNRIVYFVLKKKSRDFDRLRSVGKIVEPGSIKHKILFLLSDKLISAYADYSITHPFPSYERHIRGLLHFQNIYLQHGILQGDLSFWLNAFEKNLRLIVTSTEMENRMLLQDRSYGYTEREVKLLGMTRFDSLKDYNTKKRIVFLPTWRAALAGEVIKGTRKRKYVGEFKNSDYCRVYNELINDERLIEVLKKKGIDADFYLHPNFSDHADDFKGNDTVTVHSEEADYVKVLGEASILITDYSGVQFDFAYQRKPLVYFHFDNIYSGDGQHSYLKSYFDYNSQGFGPICYNVTEVVDHIIDIIDQDCNISKEYENRVDSFFKYDDHDNCKRVYDYIKSI